MSFFFSFNFVQLEFPGTTITSLSVEMKNGEKTPTPNLLETYWVYSDMNMSRGLDFAPKGNVYARLKHLQHTPFVYKIRIENSSVVPLRGTIRIFLAPAKSEFDLPFAFNNHRPFMIEMDRFTANRQ